MAKNSLTFEELSLLEEALSTRSKKTNKPNSSGKYTYVDFVCDDGSVLYCTEDVASYLNKNNLVKLREGRVITKHHVQRMYEDMGLIMLYKAPEKPASPPKSPARCNLLDCPDGPFWGNEGKPKNAEEVLRRLADPKIKDCKRAAYKMLLATAFAKEVKLDHLATEWPGIVNRKKTALNELPKRIRNMIETRIAEVMKFGYTPPKSPKPEPVLPPIVENEPEPVADQEVLTTPIQTANIIQTSAEERFLGAFNNSSIARSLETIAKNIEQVLTHPRVQETESYNERDEQELFEVLEKGFFIAAKKEICLKPISQANLSDIAKKFAQRLAQKRLLSTEDMNSLNVHWSAKKHLAMLAYKLAFK